MKAKIIIFPIFGRITHRITRLDHAAGPRSWTAQSNRAVGPRSRTAQTEAGMTCHVYVSRRGVKYSLGLSLENPFL